MKKIVEELIQEIVEPMLDLLAQKGDKLLLEAYEGADFQNDTFNLKDSYGFGVYYNGNLVRQGNLGSAQADEKIKYRGEYISGRDELDDYLHSYKAPKDTIQLIIVAAVPYSSDLERGISMTQKYRVISYINNTMDELASELSLFNAKTEFKI